MGVNVFDGQPHDLEEVRGALALGADVPILHCDARDRASIKTLLVEVTAHALARARRAS